MLGTIFKHSLPHSVRLGFAFKPSLADKVFAALEVGLSSLLAKVGITVGRPKLWSLCLNSSALPTEHIPRP